MATVSVACKIPNGLHLEVANSEGPPTRVTICGSAQARRMDSEGNVTFETARVIAGYGITPVDQAFWEAWLAQNKDSRLVKEMMIFAAPKVDVARDTAKELGASVKTGLEALDPTKPPKGIERADKAAA